ncbi:MAG: MotA/TolQ/ExbB proton channel family protein [Verrucomicrobiota bacterium]
MKNRSKTCFSTLWLIAVLSLGGLNSALSQEGDVPAPEVEKSVTLLTVYNEGGWIMHVLLLFSIGTIAVIVYSFIRITPKKMAPKGLHDSLVRHMQDRDVGNAYNLCQENPNSYSNVVSAALLKVNFDRDKANKDSMDQAAGEALDQEEVQQMQWVNYLNNFATIAPMIGLLGTVMGMMQAFGDLSAGKSEPSELAGGINKAMGTTAGGLVVGIPAMFFYFFFRNRLMGIMSEIQRRASFLIDVLSGEVKLSGEGAPAGEEEETATESN